MNTWPDNIRKPLTQSEHTRWNSYNYPGTRQLCDICGEPTGNCEEDSLHDCQGNTLCEDCFEETLNK
jgi:hypothetical protein